VAVKCPEKGERKREENYLSAAAFITRVGQKKKKKRVFPPDRVLTVFVGGLIDRWRDVLSVGVVGTCVDETRGKKTNSAEKPRGAY